LRQLEDKTAESDPSFTVQALNWLASQLVVSEDSHHSLLIVLSEVSQHCSSPSLSSSTFEEPWWEIFHFLGWHYIRLVINGTLSVDDYETVGTLVRCANVPAIRRRITPEANHERDPTVATYWNQYSFEESDLVMYQETLSANMTFILARTVPVPSVGSKYELERTIQLIKWRNSAGRKGIAIWKQIVDHSDLYTSEYLESCAQCFAEVIQIFAKKEEALLSFTSLWIDAQTEEATHNQLAEMLEVFEKYIKIDGSPKFHRALIRLVCQEMERIGLSSPNSSAWSESLTKRLANIHDPCLAVLGGYACGTAVSVEGGMSRHYTKKYPDSIKTVQSFAYQNLSLSDPSSLWQLRAAVMQGGTLRSMYRDALLIPEKLVCLIQVLCVPQLTLSRLIWSSFSNTQHIVQTTAQAHIISYSICMMHFLVWFTMDCDLRVSGSNLRVSSGCVHPSSEMWICSTRALILYWPF
jgi:hypothetical protein